MLLILVAAAAAAAKSPQSCPTLCDPIDGSPTGSQVPGILQARILEWVVFPFSRGSSQPRDQTQVSLITGKFFTSWATGEAHDIYGVGQKIHLGWKTQMNILANPILFD